MNKRSVVVNLNPHLYQRMVELAAAYNTSVESLLEAQAEELCKRVPSESTVLMDAWISEAIKTIAKMPKGTKFKSLDLLPKTANPVQARVFGRRLYSMVRRTKVCQFVNRHGEPLVQYMK